MVEIETGKFKGNWLQCTFPNNSVSLYCPGFNKLPFTLAQSALERILSCSLFEVVLNDTLDRQICDLNPHFCQQLFSKECWKVNVKLKQENLAGVKVQQDSSACMKAPSKETYCKSGIWDFLLMVNSNHDHIT